MESQNESQIDSLLKIINSGTPSSNQYDAYAHLWNYYIDKDMSKSMEMSERLIELGEILSLDSIKYFGYERKAVTHAYQYQLDSSGVYFRKALKHYSMENNYRKMATVQRNLGQDFQILSNYDSALFYFNDAEKNFAKALDTVGLGDIYMSKAVVHLEKGHYNLALEKAIASSKIAEKYNNLVDLHLSYMPIAVAYTASGDSTSAINFYEKALKYFAKEGFLRQQATANNLLSSLYIAKKDSLERTQELIDEGIKLFTELNDKSRLGDIYRQQGKLHLINRNYNEALKSLKRSRSLMNEIDNKGNAAPLHLAFMDYYYDTGNFKKAIEEGLEGIQLAETQDFIDSEKEFVQRLSKCYDAFGNTTKSLEYYKRFKILTDSIYSKAKSQQQEELKIIYETEEREKELLAQESEIALLEEKQKASFLRNTLLSIGLLGSVIILLLVYYASRQKQKRSQLEKIQLDRELAFKEKELTAHALHLAKKNEVLESLKQKAKDLKSKNTSNGYQQLIQTINFDLKDDDNWDNFKKYFEAVHKDFNGNVKTKYPEVTSNELRLMALLKMNLSSKEIANILNISNEGIKKARYRLRKKLNLTSDESLQDLVLSL
ncbi:MAG: tetratricopeptide repeat protein [bacterium]